MAVRTSIYKEPCPKCGGSLTPHTIPNDNLNEWIRCINCGKLIRFDKPKVTRERT